MNDFNLDDIESLLEGELEKNTSRISENETKEANKETVQKHEINIKQEIAQLTKKKKDAGFNRVGNGNINKSVNSVIGFKRAKLIFESEDRNPTDAKLNEYLMMIGEELLYAAQRNSELRALIKNFGIPKP